MCYVCLNYMFNNDDLNTVYLNRCNKLTLELGSNDFLAGRLLLTVLQGFF